MTVPATLDDPPVIGGRLRADQPPRGGAVTAGARWGPVARRSGNDGIIDLAPAWDLDSADLDLELTQPDDDTAWYGNKITAIGGQLDVDNTQAFGPENYSLSSEAGNTVLPGTYTIGVHYYSDHLKTADMPTR